MNQKEACQGMMKMLIGDNEKKLRSKPPSKWIHRPYQSHIEDTELMPSSSDNESQNCITAGQIMIKCGYFIN
jgi:hypothetical protein